MGVMDVALQVGHQSHAHRLVLYHQKRHVLKMFPEEGFGDEALELGPRSNKSGPCLTLLCNVTVSPEEFLKWFETSLLKTMRQVDRVYFLDPKKTVASREDLLEVLKADGPPEDGGAIRLQCNPRSTEKWLGDVLPESFVLDPRSCRHVLSVVEAEGKLWHRMHTSEWLFLNSATDPGVKSHTCSKAHNKLEEALAVADASIDGRSEWCAVDLGAAPGAWTATLAQQVNRVIAVDPAELSDFAKDRPNVTHLRKKAEDSMDEIKEISGPSGGVDVLVCDMNKHPQFMSGIVKGLLPVLKSGALMVMTFKFYGVGRERGSMLKEVLNTIGPGICDAECVWLLANTVNERTLIARRQ